MIWPCLVCFGAIQDLAFDGATGVRFLGLHVVVTSFADSGR